MIDTSLIDVSFIGYTDNPNLFFDTPDYTQTEILNILTGSEWVDSSIVRSNFCIQ